MTRTGFIVADDTATIEITLLRPPAQISANIKIEFTNLAIDQLPILREQLEIIFGGRNVNAKFYIGHWSVTFAELYLSCLHSSKWLMCKLQRPKVI